jgi:hypothetical protein
MRMMNWCVDETLEWFRSRRLTHLIILLITSCETKFEGDSPHSLIVGFETSLWTWYSNSDADIPCWDYALVIESLNLSTCQSEFKSLELLSWLPLKGVHLLDSPSPHLQFRTAQIRQHSLILSTSARSTNQLQLQILLAIFKNYKFSIPGIS